MEANSAHAHAHDTAKVRNLPLITNTTRRRARESGAVYEHMFYTIETCVARESAAQRRPIEMTGAGDGTRTRNFQLGKLTLYH